MFFHDSDFKIFKRNTAASNKMQVWQLKSFIFKQIQLEKYESPILFQSQLQAFH